MASLEERFWNKVNKQGPFIIRSRCWIWTGAKFTHGYGAFYPKNKTVSTHRFSYELNIGLIPKGMMVCHRCDNPQCIRPSHLFIGSGSDNTRDMISKGRSKRSGEDCNAIKKLSNKKVREIRERYKWGNGIALSKEYGVSRPTISAVVNKKRWSHL